MPIQRLVIGSKYLKIIPDNTASSFAAVPRSFVTVLLLQTPQGLASPVLILRGHHERR